MDKVTRFLLVSATAALALSGCRGKQDTDNPDVAADFQDNKYEQEIVTGQNRKDYDDQGKGISSKVLQSIRTTISTVYQRDFERCLEEQMDVEETRFLRTAFTVNFKIDTKGSVSDIQLKEIWIKKQDAKGTNLGDVDSAGMSDCIKDRLSGWEFDPPPEVDYYHTYSGQVGEAF